LCEIIDPYKEGLVVSIQQTVWLGLIKQYKEGCNSQMRDASEVKMED